MRQGGAYNPAPIVEAAMLPMMGGVAGTGEGGVAIGAGPIRAYHGSPHDFDKFDLAKIGSGEGAQAYGHGLYFAESEPVARSYRDALSGNPGNFGLKAKAGAPPELEGVLKDVWKQTGASSYDDAIRRLGAMRDEAMTKAQASFEGNLLPKDAERQYSLLSQTAAQHEDRLRYLLDNQEHLAPHKGHMYEVNLNADPAHFLDWDKALREQPHANEIISTIEKNQWGHDPLSMLGKNAETAKGADVYHALKQWEGTHPSAALSEAGIPGIKYLDQGSRGKAYTVQPTYKGEPYGDPVHFDHPHPAERWAQEQRDKGFGADVKDTGSRNYVVFNPGIIDIMRKYGLAGVAPAGIGALAAQDRYQPQEQM
jgi:hypothetical protein